MTFKTISSGLTIKVPTDGTKNWGSALESECWNKVSEHDHTGSGKGKQIGTSAISNSAITLAKIQNISTDTLIGRDTALSGAPEEISVGGGIEFSGSGGLRLADNGITTAKILDGQITEAKLADDAATRRCQLGLFAPPAFGTLTDGTIGDTNLVLFNVPKVTMPKAGKVTHISCNLVNQVTSGTLTITLVKNGAVMTGKNLSITGGYDNVGALSSPESFAAGDEIGLVYSHSSVTYSSGSTNAVVIPWGLFTE